MKRAPAAVVSPYDEVAARLRIDVLERRCRLGFAPFAAEVRKLCE